MSNRRKGVALMLALWLIVLLSVLGARVVSLARNTSGVASNLRAVIAGRYAAESGIVLAASSLRDSLARIGDADGRRAYLNSLQPGSAGGNETSISEERFSVVYVDVNSRLDVNNSSSSQLGRLFSYFVGPVDAAAAANAVRSYIDAPKGPFADRGPYGSQRSDLKYPVVPAARPLRTLDELAQIPGMPAGLAVRSAPYLTVDGDGRINRSAASDTVLAAAAGSLVDEPTRLLIISRGWLNNHPLTHEIQAVYAIEGNSLVLVRWQERDI